MTATLSSLGPITINSTTIATLGHTVNRGVIELLQNHSGLPYSTANVIPGATPKITFRCYYQDIHALTGLTILNASTFSVYLSTYTSLIRDSSSTHTKLALTSSCSAAVQILSASADQDGILIAEVEATILAATSDTHPLTLTTNNALPALTAEPIKHTLGPCVINGTGLPGVQSASIDLAPTLVVSRSDGDLYPKTAAQTRGEPKLTVGHQDAKGVLGTLGLLGTNVTANVVQYFRRADATTGVIGASNGISFTVASGRVTPTTVQANPGAVAGDGFELTGLSSSTTHPFTVSLTATVPAAA